MTRMAGVVLGLFLLQFGSVAGVPYFARKFNFTCTTCHTLPPALNQFGMNFVARGYRIDGLVPAHKTVPLAVWATQRVDHRQALGVTKSFPTRLELISGGEFSDRVAYFLEWRPVSFEVGPGGVLRDRSGRFEDLFLIFTLSERFLVTAGQFRMLAQWDVSRRLSLSTPVGFAAGVGGRPASDPRIQSLRSFSLEGRAPAVRFTAIGGSGPHPGDGWFHEWTVPFAGELSTPLTRQARTEASFELEARPKGLFYETYRRRGLDSYGGSLFVGDDRWLANLTGQKQLGGAHFLYASVGTARFRTDLQDFRMSLGDYWIPRPWVALGVRLDHRTADRLPPAFVPHLNFHYPGEKHTFMLVLEPFLQRRNSGIAAELSVIF